MVLICLNAEQIVSANENTMLDHSPFYPSINSPFAAVTAIIHKPKGTVPARTPLQPQCRLYRFRVTGHPTYLRTQSGGWSPGFRVAGLSSFIVILHRLSLASHARQSMLFINVFHLLLRALNSNLNCFDRRESGLNIIAHI